MSQFGHEWMKKFNLDPVYVPHGVDTKLFRPQPETKNDIRDELGIPRDAFLVGMVAANRASAIIPRKGFSQALDAFAQFAEAHKDAWLYIHTDPTANLGGIDLDILAHALATFIDYPVEQVCFPPLSVWQLGFKKQSMAHLYQAFDVLLNPSLGEGFGIPVLEAQASGVPVIASDHSAMTELTQAGWLVSGERLWDPQQESWLITPSIASIANALEASYEARDDRALREGAREFAMMYDADRVTLDFWVPALERLSGLREVPPLNGKSRQVRRAEERKAAKARA